MAKRPVRQDVLRKDGGLAHIIEGDELTGDGITSYGADSTTLWAYDHLAVDSEGKPRLVVPDDTPFQAVSLALPRAVLIALLDATHELADAESATGLGLLQDGALTAVGALVIAGTDKTALGHKMAAAWRARHNTETDNKR